MTDLLPSAAALTVAAFKADPEITAITEGRVGTRLNKTLPAIRVQRVYGTSPDTWQDQPVMQIECWAADEGTADRLARTVVAVLPSMRDSYSTGRVWAHTVESGPFFAPDDPALSNNVRYILTVRWLTST